MKVGGRPAPLFYVSPGQVNVQFPFEGRGDLSLELARENGSATSRPIVIYATGLGSCLLATGFGVPPSTAAPADIDVSVTVGNTAIQPAYAGWLLDSSGWTR